MLVELQNKVVETSRQLAGVRAQISARDREKKLSELTAKELESMGENVSAYRAVGKMYVNLPQSLAYCVQLSTPELFIDRTMNV